MHKMKNTQKRDSRMTRMMTDLIFDTLIGAYDLYTYEGCQKLAKDLYENGLVVVKRRDDENEKGVH